MITNSLIKQKASMGLSGYWGTAALTTLVYSLIASASSFFCLSIFIVGPLAIGYQYLFYRFHRDPRDSNMINNMFTIFSHKYLQNLFLALLMYCLIACGLILFIVPGIIAALGFAMAPYILQEKEEINAWDALMESWEMMRGYKMQLFLLCLSFIGWMLLVILTVGIAALWVAPYYRASIAIFYSELKLENSNYSAA